MGLAAFNRMRREARAKTEQIKGKKQQEAQETEQLQETEQEVATEEAETKQVKPKAKK